MVIFDQKKALAAIGQPEENVFYPKTLFPRKKVPAAIGQQEGKGF